MEHDYILIDRWNCDEQFTEERKKQFKKLFIESFPNDDEREEPDDIISRIKTPSRGVYSIILLAFNSENNEVIGAAVGDKYFDTKLSEIIYIFVKKDCRKTGIGSEMCGVFLSILGGTALIEVEDPEKQQPDCRQEMPLEERIKFYEQFGIEDCVKNYYQPPLSEGKKWANNLKLCSIGKKPDNSEIARFLHSIYRGLGYEENETGKEILAKMTWELLGDVLKWKPISRARLLSI